MRRLLLFPLFLALLLNAADPAPQSLRRPDRTQQATPSAGPCSATLSDGRSFLTGGSGPEYPVATAAFFRKDGQILPAAPMLAPRSSHVCIALRDGSVLVAGGVSGSGGPTSSAEIYQPATNLWTTTGAMLTARTDAAAILLPNGNVLVAGGQTFGQIDGTLEIYDPTQGRFRRADGVLSSPRARHAIALLRDGRVLIAGGYDGTQTLDTIDIFDPSSESVRPAGLMTSRRSDFTATELADGRILLVGGFDGSSPLASAEVWDPATQISAPVSPLAAPRRNHLAIRPAASANVLVAGGSQLTAEIFVPGIDAFAPATENKDGVPTGETVTVAVLDAAGKPRAVKTYLLQPATAPPRNR